MFDSMYDFNKLRFEQVVARGKHAVRTDKKVLYDMFLLALIKPEGKNEKSRRNFCDNVFWIYNEDVDRPQLLYYVHTNILFIHHFDYNIVYKMNDDIIIFL